jgi:parallel beta-helix repeat protein
MTSPSIDRRLGLAGNTAFKAPCVLATTANVTLSGEQSIDGTTTSESRVLVWQQTDTSENGIYNTSSGSWTRALDANGNYDLTYGTQVYVAGGATQGGTAYTLTTSTAITIDTTGLVWAASTAVGNLATQLASSASAVLGPALVGYSGANAYAANTVGAALNTLLIADSFSSLSVALAAALAAGGGGVWLTPGKRYTLTTRLSIPARCGLISDGTAEIYAPAASFTNTSLAGTYGATSSVLDLSGLTTGLFTVSESPFVIGVRVTSEVSQGRLVDAIVARNVKNVRIKDCEISGFPVGCGVRGASLLGGEISGNFIHDFTDNAVWGSAPQITGIEIDQDRVNSVSSVGVNISGNRIKDITVGATVLASWGYQTDGINIAHASSGGHTIANNRISGVGEGIDIFGSTCTITGNVISQCYIFGMKFIHGASYNSVMGGSISDVGLAGIRFDGAATAVDTERNTVTGVTIASIDYLGAYAASDSACILFSDGASGKPQYNTVIGCTLTLGSGGKYGWLDTSSGTAHANFGLGNQIITGASVVALISVTAAGGACNASGSATFNPGNLVDGAGETTTVSVVGAMLGDFASASFGADLQGITLTAWVSATNVVSVRFQNETGGDLNLASSTLRAVTRGI